MQDENNLKYQKKIGHTKGNNNISHQFFLECSSLPLFTPNILVTSALNSNVDELRT